MIIHSPIISGSLTFAEGATVTYPDGGSYSGSFSGSIQVSEVKSHMIPDTSASYDLGSEAFPFRDLYISSGTGFIGGIGISAGIGGLNLKNKSDNTPAAIAASELTIGGLLGGVNTKKFKLNTNNKVTLLDENDDEDVLEVKELILKDTSGNGKNTKLKNDGGRFTTTEVNDSDTETAANSEGALSGSFTGSIQDAEFNGDATFNDNATFSGTVDATGLASLDGGIDVGGVFTVADSTGNVQIDGSLITTNDVTFGGTSEIEVGQNATLSVLGKTVLTNTEVTGSVDIQSPGTLKVGSGRLLINEEGVTSTAGELNLLDGAVAGNVANSKAVVYGAAGEVNATKLQVGGVDITSTPAELNILDGVTATTAELNILDGVTATATEINALDGITVDATKLNYLTDMTGNVKSYVDTAVAGVVDTAPEALDTLNELAAALGDDANFSTTITTLIGTKASSSIDLTAGAGLTGGGDLTADRTFNVVGTTNRISVSADAVDIASTYVGQTSITTLGTIGTGTWEGTAIAHDYIGLDAIDGTNISDDSINSEHIVDGSVDNVHLAGSIANDKLSNSEITINGTAVALGGTRTLDTDDVAEGTTNEYFTTARARAAISAGTGVSISSGEISIGQAVATNSAVTFASVSATGDIVAYASSDERLKDNIEVISNPIEKVQQLKGVTWDWNDNADELQKSLPNVGVIAQDVEKVLPQLVKDRDTGFKGVDYDKIVGLLIEAIKDQQTQIDELKSKLS